MRTLLRAAAAAFVGTLALAGTAQAQQQGGGLKLAYVNTQAVLQAAPGREAAEKRFEAEANGFREQLKRMQDSLNTMITEFNKVQASLTDAQREERATAIRTRQLEYQQRAGQFEEQMQQRQLEFFQPVMQQIEKILGDIRREQGYAMIFDVGQNGAGIVAADTTLDVTQQVIARLKASPPPAAAPATQPARPAGPVAQPAGATTRRTP